MFWTRSRRHLIVADWYDIENNVTSKIRVHRFKFKEVGIRNRRTHLHFITQMMIASPKSGEFRRLRSVRNFGQEGRILAMRKWCFLQQSTERRFLKLIAKRWNPGRICLVSSFVDTTKDAGINDTYRRSLQSCKEVMLWNTAESRVGRMMRIHEIAHVDQARSIPSPCDDPSYFCRGLQNHVLHLLYVFCVEPGRILERFPCFSGGKGKLRHVLFGRFFGNYCSIMFFFLTDAFLL